MSPSLSPIPEGPPAELTPPLPQFIVTVTSHLTHHSITPAQTAKGKPKDKKEQKTKEHPHTFSPTTDNYLLFLKAVLAKHGEAKYNVTAK
jgi:hypothetical protein